MNTVATAGSEEASGPEALVGLAARGLGPSPGAAMLLRWQESPGKDNGCNDEGPELG